MEHNQNNQNQKLKLLEKGSILIYSVLVMAVVLTVSMTLMRTLILKFYVAREAINSTIAIYVADSAMEWCIFSNGDNPATSPTVPPQPTNSINGTSHQIYRNSTTSTCPSGENVNYRTVGNYRGISRSLEVYEIIPPPLQADIKCDNTDGPCSVAWNSTAQIEWCGASAQPCQNATSCSVTRNGSPSWTGTSGSFSSGPLASGTHTYELSCTDGSQTATDTVQLIVGSPFLVDTGGTLATNLIAYWRLNEASGTRVDGFGTNNLSSVNGVGTAGGKVNNAANFNVSSSQYLSIPDNANLSVGNQDFTIAVWVRPASKPSQAFIAAHTLNAGNQRSWNIDYLSSVDRFRFVVSSDGTSSGFRVIQADSAGSPSVNTWYLIIVWHDSNADTINIQVNNGSIDSASHSTGVFNSNASWTMGTRGDIFDFWDGRIDEVGFWKKVLTSQERLDLWNGGNGNTLQ